jgi:hypothetical protein
LLRILGEWPEEDMEYKGMCMAVFTAIWLSPGRQIDHERLSGNILKYESNNIRTYIMIITVLSYTHQYLSAHPQN